MPKYLRISILVPLLCCPPVRSLAQSSEKTHEIDRVVVTGQSVKAQMQTSGFAVDVVDTRKLAVQSVQAGELLDRRCLLLREDA